MPISTDIVRANALKIKICEALGLDPSRVGRIVIDISAVDDPLLVEVTMFGGSSLVDVDWSPDVMEVRVSE